MMLLLLPLLTPQTVSEPWLWALPFLFTFIGGVFADVLETRQRQMFLALGGMAGMAQATVCILALPQLVAEDRCALCGVVCDASGRVEVLPWGAPDTDVQPKP